MADIGGPPIQPPPPEQAPETVAGELASLEAFADRLDRVVPGRSGAARDLLRQLEQLDIAVYTAIARTPTPTLDRSLRRLSHAANYSRLWMGTAAALALLGGRRGRRAAVGGLASVGLASAVANLAVKPVAERSRPDRVGGAVPELRHVRMPTSRSFPSGHSASAFAFAAGASREVPALAPVLHLVAAAVAYSRVHTGVHYPGDVLVGSVLGTATGEIGGAITSRALRRRAFSRRAPQ
jgi:membrane-associated phospholipid phosphatase